MKAVEPRTKMRSQRYTEAEDRATERAAAKAKMTVAAYIRAAVARARCDREA